MQVHFWNGNKSPIRKAFEPALLKLCLEQAGVSDLDLCIDENDYPSAEDEGNIFKTQCEVLVTVAGNQKFINKDKIIIELPICRGILGNRLLIIRLESAEYFSSINELKQLSTLCVGVPNTWADAEIFRYNGFEVNEGGDLHDVFFRLQKGEFDYVALGANEIEGIFSKNRLLHLNLLIEPTLLVHYPLPLVFYVNPDKPQLAQLLETGLRASLGNGKHRDLFNQYHGNIVERLMLERRTRFDINNPHLTPELLVKLQHSEA